MLFWIVIIVVLVLFYLWFFKVRKNLVLEALTLVNGGVKTGKSTLTIYLAIKSYKKVLRRWKIRKVFRTLLGKEPEEKPLLYSNIPLKCDYVLLSNDVLQRTKRIPYGSVVYIGEFTLVADNKFFKNASAFQIESLMLFIKLFGHETGGKGKMFIDTQCISDLPVDVRRCLNRYIWIERSIRWVPFIIIFKVRELMYSEDTSSVNVFNSDIEDNTKVLIISKSIWKKFDYCCYSVFTDSLDVSNKVVNGKLHDHLKVDAIPSFKTYKTIPTYSEEKKEVVQNGKQKVK